MTARLAAVSCAAVALVCAAAGAADARAPLVTAVQIGDTSRVDLDLAFAHVRDTGATVVRLDLRWATIAPTRPASPANPADPAYRWDDFDRLVLTARAHGLAPIVSFLTAPAWAQPATQASKPPDVSREFGSAYLPDPVAFAAFVHAAALRYGGAFEGLPRVRYWHVWNEPNASKYLMPQYVGGLPAAPALYRTLVNRMAAAVKSVHADNLVVAGGQSPFTYRSRGLIVMPPLVFMRTLLCMSEGKHPKPTCSARIRFDVWAHHPYTAGGPTHKAARRDDASLGDLGEMRRLLQSAVKAGHVIGNRHPRFWVTEFLWDSRPPDRDPTAVPLRLHARWVSEALYRMWKAGVTLVTWHQLRDFPYATSPFQGGLYFEHGSSLAADTPKPSLVAFRFPFVAYRDHGRLLVWGRTPSGRSGRVVVEERLSGRWRLLGRVRAGAGGVFTARLRPRRSARSPAAYRAARGVAGATLPAVPWALARSLLSAGAAVRAGQFDAFMLKGRGPFLRARLTDGSESSLPFSLVRPRDRTVQPFGGGGP